MNWKQMLMIAGGTAAAGAVLYYLLREETAPLDNNNDEKDKKVNVNQITKQEVLRILKDIIKSQEKMKSVMKELTQELMLNKYSFPKAYQRVREVQPDDPLERCGVSMTDFDRLLEKYQNDPHIREAIGKIMGAPGPSGYQSGKSIAKTTLVKVHEFMLLELQKLVAEFDSLPNRSSYEMKTVTIAAQAMVGAKVEEKFKLTSEDIEASVLEHHQALAGDADFARINLEMQATMSQLMGSHFPPY